MPLQHLLKKLFTVFGMLAFLGACASSDDQIGTATMADTVVEDDSSGGPGAILADDVEVDVIDMGPTPGTQAHLDANVGDRMFFMYDSAELSAVARRQLQQQAAWLRQFPNTRVVVEGHCDERGTREYNIALGDRRAVVVKNYLVALGVSADRIDTISYGKERPIDPMQTESAWSKNRRAVMVVR